MSPLSRLCATTAVVIAATLIAATVASTDEIQQSNRNVVPVALEGLENGGAVAACDKATACNGVDSLRQDARDPGERLAELRSTLEAISSQEAQNGSDSVSIQRPQPAPAPKNSQRVSNYRVAELTTDLEAVRAFVETGGASVPVEAILPSDLLSMRFAAVTEEVPGVGAPAPTPGDVSEQPTAPAEPPGAPAAPAEAPAAPPAAQGAEPPAEPAPGEPEPPAKREPGTAIPAILRMQKILTGLTDSTTNPAAEGLKVEGEAPPAAQVEPAAKELEPLARVAEAPRPKPETEPEPPAIVGDPLDQIVSIDFREMELSNVVALLAQKAQINVIAGADLRGVVTANLKNVTLRRAIETVLRMNNLGMTEEEGIFHIVPYEEAIAAKRITTMVKLDNAKASEIKKTFEQVLKGTPEDTLTTISTDDNTNTLIIAGAETRVNEFQKMAKDLDVEKPVTPTITEAIKINNAAPKDLEALVKSMLSPELGKVALDERSRHLVVTDVPVVLEQIRELVQQIDLPVKQVSVDTMVVDAVLGDDSQTGVDWILSAVKRTSRRGEIVGDLQNLSTEVDSTGQNVTPGTLSPQNLAYGVTFGILSGDINLRAVISAEVAQENAKLLANPVVVTVENKPAKINISEEIPYQELTQSVTGPPMSSTEFKDVGIVMQVTPMVSHDDHIVSNITIKQSDTKGEVNNIPVEDKREAETTLRTRNGQTVFIGGLRRFDNSTQTKKVPVLGDVPIINFAFRNNIIRKTSTELLIFMTSNVLPDEMEGLSPELQGAHDELDGMKKIPDSQKTLWRTYTHPNELPDDPSWKWRRSR